MSELSDYRKYIGDPHIKRLEGTIDAQAAQIRQLHAALDKIAEINKDFDIEVIIQSAKASAPAPVVFEAPGKKIYG